MLHGDSYSDAYAHALALQSETGATFVHPYDDPDVIAGQGTIGMEILRQWQGPLDAIFVAIGGGGLAAGIASYVKRVRPEIRIIGVQPVDSDAMARSIAAGRRVKLAHVGLFADGVAVKEVGKETFRICRELLDDIVLVDTDAGCAAIKDVFEDTRSILEPAGALAVAGIKAWCERHHVKDHTFVAIACGANMNFDRLRFVAERAELGERREAILAVTIPERPGSFREFCELLGKRSVTEFNYRYSDPKQAHLFVGLQVANRHETAQLLAELKRRRIDAYDLSDNEMAKLHVRHLVGGHAPAAKNELVYRFEFPERPGRADAVPRQHEPRLEHQPLPLPQPRRRLRARARGHPGAAGGDGRVPRVPRPPGLRLRRRDGQSRLPDVPGALTPADEGGGARETCSTRWKRPNGRRTPDSGKVYALVKRGEPWQTEPCTRCPAAAGRRRRGHIPEERTCRKAMRLRASRSW